jgi:hypothetical protein
MDDISAEDLANAIKRYQRLLQQLDEEVPADFPLVDLVRKSQERDDSLKELYQQLGDPLETDEEPQEMEPAAEKPAAEEPAAEEPAAEEKEPSEQPQPDEAQPGTAGDMPDTPDAAAQAEPSQPAGQPEADEAQPAVAEPKAEPSASEATPATP